METPNNPVAPMIPPPLDVDLATVDISMPLLADGIYDLRIVKAEIKPTAGGGRMIHLDHVTTDPAMGRTGAPLGAGVHLFNNVNVVPSGKATWEMVAKSVGGLVQAAEFPAGVARLDNVEQWTPMLVGKIVRAKVVYKPAGVSKNGKAFKEANEIQYYTKRTA